MTLTQYNTNDNVYNSSEIALQASNGLFIIFPSIALCFIQLINQNYAKKIILLLLLTIFVGFVSIINHLYDDHTGKQHSTSHKFFSYLDSVSCAIAIIIAFLIIFNKLMRINPSQLSGVKYLYRAYFIVIFIIMILTYLIAKYSQIKSQNPDDPKEIEKIYNIYHSIWHVCGGMMVLIIILYIFTVYGKNQKTI